MPTTDTKEKNPLVPPGSALPAKQDAEKFDIFLTDDYDVGGETGKVDLAPSPKGRVKVNEKRELYKAAIDKLSPKQFEEFDAHMQASPLAESFGLASKTEEPALDLPTTAPALWEELRDDYEGTPVDFVREHYSRWIGAKGFNRSFLSSLDERLVKAYVQRVDNHPHEELGIPKRPYKKRKGQSTSGKPVPSGHIPTRHLPPEQQAFRRAGDAERQARSRDKKKGLGPE